MLEKSPEVDIIVYFVNQLHPKTVLEVGCNYGRELKHLELNTNAKLYGIDTDPKKIEQAKNYVLDATFKVGDASQIPYNANKFELVYSTGVLAHTSPDKVMQIVYELERVSSKYILIVEYIGSHLSRNTVENCKKNAWVHDYDKLLSGIDIIIKYTNKLFFGADCFKVVLMKKDSRKIHETEVIREVSQEHKFEIKIGKFKWGIW